MNDSEKQRKLINNMAKYADRIDRLYDKLMPIYRESARSVHRIHGVKSVIKKRERELKIMKAKASKMTKTFNRERKQTQTLNEID